MLPRPLFYALTGLITLMWAVNLSVGLLFPGRSDPYVNAIFGMVVAAVYALGRKGSAEQRNLASRAREKLEQLAGDEDKTEGEGQ